MVAANASIPARIVACTTYACIAIRSTELVTGTIDAPIGQSNPPPINQAAGSTGTAIRVDARSEMDDVSGWNVRIRRVLSRNDALI
jgi:hypothetical protein